MGKMQLRQEALRLQGTNVRCQDRLLHISGGFSQAEFESGSEGLVLLATDEDTGEKFRIKCFWDPHETRRRRSQKLVHMKLPDLNKTKADALGGAPFLMLPALGACTPFAVVMKNVRGENWKKLRERVRIETGYPPDWWPAAEIRATWGYGLATAVMKMEAMGFIHADLSPGNVVVNDGFHGVNGARKGHSDDEAADDEAGDMALVDFDRYVHPPGDLPEPGQGSEGYAAREIWQQQIPSLGSDRTAMAILIQEFLVTGDPDLSREQSLDWSYDQAAGKFRWSFSADDGASAEPGEVHPLLERKYPALATLIRDTLSASAPESRPGPQSWRKPLRDIVGPLPAGNRSQFRGLTIVSDSAESPPLRIPFGPTRDRLDLLDTAFKIHASLERDPAGAMFLVVHDQAILNIRMPGKKQWTDFRAGQRIPAEIGMVLFDRQGKCNARLDRPK